MISERFKFVPIGQAKDLNSAATVDLDSINMKNVLKATIYMTFDTLGTASAVMTVNSGATDGTCTSTMYYNRAWGGAAIGTATAGSTTSCDVPAAWTNEASTTITYGTYSNYGLTIEIDPACMDAANDEEWLTVRFTDPGGATGTLDAFAVLEMRSAGNRMDTVLA